LLGKIVILTSIALVLPYAKPEEYVNRGDDFYMTNDATTTSSSEYMPLWVKENPTNLPDHKVVLSGVGSIDVHIQKSDAVNFIASVPTRTKATINTIYYPGWEAHINGQRAPITYNNRYGVMEVLLPEGRSTVELTFRETVLRTISNSISIVSVAIVGILLLYTIIRKRFIFETKKK
jgi:uncharacterized membrane protein YfhO